MATPISLVVITFNEEKNITRCLQSVRSMPWAQDIVVLDSGSTDGTVELAKQMGARVFVEEWRGYGPQKQRAVELAQCDWILSLDADEALSVELRSELSAAMQNRELGHDGADGYSMPRLTYHLGRWIRHGGWYPDRQVRLFDRRRASWDRNAVHERVSGQHIQNLKGDIHHFPFDGQIAKQIETNNEYSSLAAMDLAGRGVAFSLGKLIGKPISKFIETYFLKGGFRDGLPGFMISVGAAYSIFLKFAKLWEEQRKAPGP